VSERKNTSAGDGIVRLRGVLRCTSMAEVEIVRQHLPEHTRLTRAEAGCLSFDVVQTDDPLIWRVEEAFVDMAAFQAHVQRS
jgi:quinol monooxygenase YgiN